MCGGATFSIEALGHSECSVSVVHGARPHVGALHHPSGSGRAFFPASHLGINSECRAPRTSCARCQSREQGIRAPSSSSRPFRLSPFQKSLFIGIRRGKSPGASCSGSAPAHQGGPERGLTTRCSGLASLAAELDIVRPHIWKAARVLAPRRSKSGRFIESIRSSLSARGLSPRCFSFGPHHLSSRSGLLSRRAARAEIIRSTARLAHRALGLGHEGRSPGPVLHRSARPRVSPFQEKPVQRAAARESARSRMSGIASACRGGPPVGPNNALQRTRYARR